MGYIRKLFNIADKAMIRIPVRGFFCLPKPNNDIALFLGEAVKEEEVEEEEEAEEEVEEEVEEKVEEKAAAPDPY